MKTTYQSKELAHAWMHGLSPHGKAPANMSFDGPVLYSYNTAIARKLEHKGKTAVLINDRSFSISTSKHQGWMRQAIPHEVEKFRFSGVRGSTMNVSPKELFDYSVEESARCLKEAEPMRKSMKKDSLHAQAARWMDQAKRVAEFYGLRRKVDEKSITRLAAAKARAEKKQQAEREEREAEARRRQVLAYEAWKNGKKDTEGTWYFNSSLFPVAFRVEGDELVSTLGARVPLTDAKRAIRFAKSKRATEWRENGEKFPVGGYHLNSITSVGIVAGCHRITWEELERVDEMLKEKKEA
jgi:hypothetical protein